MDQLSCNVTLPVGSSALGCRHLVNKEVALIARQSLTLASYLTGFYSQLIQLNRTYSFTCFIIYLVQQDVPLLF